VIRHYLARTVAVALAAAALFAPLAARAADFVPPPTPTQWVTDTVGLLSPGARDGLNQKLEAYERQSGHHVLVWIGASAGEVPIEEFAVKSFEKWKPGRAGQDDGLVFFLFTQDRKIKIEVGYGLEPVVTDLTSSRIIREVVAPRLQAGDADGAISAGITALLRAIDAGGSEATGGGKGSGGRETARPVARPAPVPRPLSVAQKVVIGLAGIGLLIFFITNPSLAIWLLMNVLSSSGGYGRSGGSSGGWSGGGGRSGGGGASGSW
jgi:uncharacterized protein